MSGDESSDESVLSGSTVLRPGDVPAVLELEHLYSALAHPRRRYLCYTLLEQTEWTLDELARKIAAWEHGVSEGEITDDQQERVYVSLYHAQVPHLVHNRVIELDEVTETISPGENAEQVLDALRTLSTKLSEEVHARGEMDE